jgi:hypothetical protein
MQVITTDSRGLYLLALPELGVGSWRDHRTWMAKRMVQLVW